MSVSKCNLWVLFAEEHYTFNRRKKRALVNTRKPPNVNNIYLSSLEAAFCQRLWWTVPPYSDFSGEFIFFSSASICSHTEAWLEDISTFSTLLSYGKVNGSIVVCVILFCWSVMELDCIFFGYSWSILAIHGGNGSAGLWWWSARTATVPSSDIMLIAITNNR